MKKLIKVFIILAVFLILAVWVGNVFAQEADQWDVVLDGPGSREAVFYPSRRLVYILALFIIIISVILALFKKFSWYWLFCLFMSLISLFIFDFLSGYLTEPLYDARAVITHTGVTVTPEVANRDFWETLFITISGIVGFIVYSLPALIALIRYKLQKIDKELLKRHLRIWSIWGLLIIGVVIGLLLLS